MDPVLFTASQHLDTDPTATRRAEDDFYVEHGRRPVWVRAADAISPVLERLSAKAAGRPGRKAPVFASPADAC